MTRVRPSTILLVTGTVSLLVALFLFTIPDSGYGYKHVPKEKDARLFGAWTNGKAMLTFAPDGSGFSKPNEQSSGKGRPFEWGTAEGRLRVKYLSVDYWQFPLLNYTLDATGKWLRLAGKHHSGMFPADLHRVRSATGSK